MARASAVWSVGVALLALQVPGSARADAPNVACTTTQDCGDKHCIDGRCITIDAARSPTRAGVRAAGWITLGIASAGATLGLVGLVFIPGACAECVGCGCTGGNWGWSAAGAMIAGVTLPLGIILVLQRDAKSTLSVQSLGVPSGCGISAALRF